MKRTNMLRHERITENARQITNMKKAKARKQRIVLSTVAVVLVAVTAASFMVFGAANARPQTADTSPSTATKLITTDYAAPKANNTPAQSDQNTGAQNTSSQTTTAQSTPAQTTSSQTTSSQSTSAQTTTAQTADAQTTSSAQQSSSQQSSDRIDNVNGERVYIDTKRPAPQSSGTPYHYYAYGKTSYGFDWTYNADNSCFMLRCDYNFNQQQYDFQFYGVTPGTAHVTLYYNTDDNVQVPVYLTVNVDSNLNVTAG